ncbi:unnamed protein product [Dibothriocephalus latus]|uniref:Uncharacterized protein n=1 Tax=Dibothriocephalus latus TaxID=60516 RepID=A0A3P6QRA1_DIBLA|nr:unnamed protein product [Dibothriocephalus latus]
MNVGDSIAAVGTLEETRPFSRPSKFVSVNLLASTILAKALLDRLRSDHTHVLLSLGGFTIFLRQADPVWIALAQKMVSVQLNV